MMLTGTHHVSTLSARIDETHGYYPEVLGLRPVIRTVNQDEPSMYHLFYGDGAGSPGSDITVFDMPNAARERRGNNSFSLTSFRVAGRPALEYWAARLGEYGFPHSGIIERDGRLALDFDDPVGTQLSLVDDAGAGEAHPWDTSPVAAEHQIRGLGYAMLTVPALDATHRFLVDGLGLALDHEYELPDAYDTTRLSVHVYRMSADGPAGEVHVTVDPAQERARYGSGGVHHVALRVPEPADMAGWAARLDAKGYRSSGEVDRHYFRSVYVREPNGLLFELASDGPGFDVDGPLDGNRLSLPPFLEPHRADIERKLKPLP
jgi:glyoxalase family protein